MGEALREQQIPEEFLTGNTRLGLAKLRTRLLDLTARNRLLNYRHSVSSSLRIVDVDLDSVFELLKDGKQLTFRHVPDPHTERTRSSEQTLWSDNPSPAEYAAELGWDTNYDLSGRGNQQRNGQLPVLYFLDKFEAISRKIASAAKSAIEESGTNMLYLTFGLLEWYESDDSSQPRLAPLITLPVSIDRSSTKSGRLECTIEYSGEDLETNLSLVEKMKADFGFSVLAVDEEGPQEYFEKLKPILKHKPRWRIRPQLTLSLLSFGKLLMYRDLDPEKWPAIADHPIVRDFFEGSKSECGEHAEEYLIDDHKPTAAVPPLILDADSSQHSVLIDALAGNNLVVEGPPGTGKSQTICNLIAAALNAGKTVLFVSEKLAALEVVRRRLDECRLGIFCLELHSHKTKKDALLRDLEERIQARRSFLTSDELGKQASLLQKTREQLSRYATHLNTTVQPSQWTLFDLIWARDREVQTLQSESLLQDTLPIATTHSQADFAETEQFVQLFSEHLRVVLRHGGSISKHPWRWVNTALGLLDEEKLITQVENAVRLVKRLCAMTLELTAHIQLPLTPTISGTEHARTLLSGLPDPASDLPPEVLSACRDESMRLALSKLLYQIRAWAVAMAECRRITGDGDVEHLLRCEAVQQLRTAGDICARRDLLDQPLSGVRARIAHWRTQENRVRHCLQRALSLAGALGQPCVTSIEGVQLLIGLSSALEAAPIDALHLRGPQFQADGAGVTVSKARLESDRLKSERATINETLVVAPELTSEQLEADAACLMTASFFERWLGKNFRAARRRHRGIRRDGCKLKPADLAQVLRRCANHRRTVAAFNNHAAYRTLLGDHFDGIDSDWDGAKMLADWYAYTYTTLPCDLTGANSARESLFSSRSEIVRHLRDTAILHASAASEMRLILADVTDLSQELKLPVRRDESLQHLIDTLSLASRELEEVVGVFESAHLPAEAPASVLTQLADALERVLNAHSDVMGNDQAREALGRHFQTVFADDSFLRRALAFAQTVLAVLPTNTSQWVLETNPSERLVVVRQGLQAAAYCGEQLSAECNAIDVLTGSQWLDAMRASSEAPQSAFVGSLASRESLQEWSHYVRLRADARTRSLDRLVDLAESSEVAAADLPHVFRLLAHNAIIRAAFGDRPELSAYSGLTQSEIRQQFIEADVRCISLFRERLAALVDRRPVPQGRHVGRAADWTDLALINREIAKAKRHIPIRQLVYRAGSALQALKPCFMMGPLSVAQYLAPGQLHFDLVIMDEASQLRPEDAMGAVARGGQVVVVGDPKQLPPTTFFQRIVDDETEDPERTVAEEGESILDVAATVYQPARRLRWHYRSRHHSLIAFSNREFYDDDLIVFPSAYNEESSLGIRFHRIADGTFDNRRNAREAARVVDAVLTHMATRPHESLGVVALNFQQAELIEELLDRRLQTEPAALAYQEKTKEGAEPFFIKNLENVQGDERDVIFISATYGPDAAGNQYQRFGPINGPNGHRRLNVLFTRAKKRTEVFCSLDPDRIVVSPSSPWGSRALKEYLLFARDGALGGVNDHTGKPVNAFEQSVAAVLRQAGHSVACQVGVAGFFIDIGVRHPTKAGSFMLGIECDGAPYHSAKSARDRDRLRQEILENLGWKLHRIWSTDWYRNRSREIQRLLARVQELADADPDYRSAKERVTRDEQLKQELKRLQSEVMAADGVSLEASLLAPRLLSEFYTKRPRTKEQFQTRIPLDLRNKIAPGQVAVYLPSVLELINRYSD